MTTYSTRDIDDAAVWIARLRAPDRSANVEHGLRRWLAEKPSHAAAFETISSAWEITGALKRRPFPKLSRWERAGFRAGFLRATVTVAVAVAALAIAASLRFGTGIITTGVGEQRVITLDDGSRISMNTATRLQVRYDESERRIVLKTGEALFEVTKSPERPFVVVVGKRHIHALGTSFIVRDDPQRLSVTLVEGKVAVNSAEDSEPASILVPGQRITFIREAPPSMDEPSMETVVAWRRGQVEFEDISLAEAAAEMNRYSTLKLHIGSSEAARLRINGIFRIGDTEGFVAALKRSYSLKVERTPRSIRVTGLPSAQALSEGLSH